MTNTPDNDQTNDMSMDEILSSIKDIILSGDSKSARRPQSGNADMKDVPQSSYPNEVAPEKDLNPAHTRGTKSFPKFHEFDAPPAASFVSSAQAKATDVPIDEIEELYDLAKDVSLQGDNAVEDVVSRTKQDKRATKAKLDETTMEDIIQRSSKRISSMYASEVPEEPEAPNPPKISSENTHQSSEEAFKDIDVKALNFVRSQLSNKVNQDSSGSYIRKFVAQEFAPSKSTHYGPKNDESREEKTIPRAQAEPEAYELKKMNTKDVELGEYDEHHLLDRLFRQLLDHLVKDVIEKMSNQWMRQNMPEMVSKQTQIEFNKLLKKLNSD